MDSAALEAILERIEDGGCMEVDLRELRQHLPPAVLGHLAPGPLTVDKLCDAAWQPGCTIDMHMTRYAAPHFHVRVRHVPTQRDADGSSPASLLGALMVALVRVAQ